MFRTSIFRALFVCVLSVVLVGCTVTTPSAKNTNTNDNTSQNENLNDNTGGENDNSQQPIPGNENENDNEAENDNETGNVNTNDNANPDGNTNVNDNTSDNDNANDNSNDNAGGDDDDDAGIVPGTGIPGVTLLVTTVSQAQAALGVADDELMTGNVFGGVTIIDQGTGIRILFDDSNVAVQIRLQAPYAGRTAGGNGIGNSWTSFQSELGTPEETDGDWLIWTSEGIAILQDGNGNAEVIELEA